MLFWYQNRCKDILEKEEITYICEKEEGREQKMTIYHNRKWGPVGGSRKCLVCIAGSYQLAFHGYIKKLMFDLFRYHFDVFSMYECIVIEKLDITSITIYKDAAHYIRERNKEFPWEEIVLLGFSAGGVVASHIMSDLHDIHCSKKIITYDTPYQIMENVKRFEKNAVFRLDYLFFLIAYVNYLCHWNYVKIADKMMDWKKIMWGYGSASELVSMIQRIHSFDYSTIYFFSGFNMKQNETTKIIHIKNEYDPIVHKDIQICYVEKRGIIIDIVKRGKIGHCSDMAFGTTYLNELMEALRL